jgi:hypothetical protein
MFTRSKSGKRDDRHGDHDTVGKRKGANRTKTKTMTEGEVLDRKYRDYIIRHPERLKNPTAQELRRFEIFQDAYRRETVRKHRGYRNPMIGQDSDSPGRKFEPYSKNRDNWTTPSKQIRNDIDRLKKALDNPKYKTSFEIDREMGRLLDLVSKDGECPPELLNDLFFLTQKRIDDTKIRYDDKIRSICLELERGLSNESHFTHGIYASFYTSLLGRDWDGTSSKTNLEVVDRNHSILKDVTFPSGESGDPVEKKIADFRIEEIESIDKLCDLIDENFKETTFFTPKTKHNDVRKSAKYLKERLRKLKESDSEGKKEQITLLRLTMIKMMADSKTYMAQSNNVERTMVCDQMLTRLNALNTPDSVIRTLPDAPGDRTSTRPNIMTAKESQEEAERAQGDIGNILKSFEQLSDHVSDEDKDALEEVKQELIRDTSLYVNTSPEAVVPSSHEMLQQVQNLFSGETTQRNPKTALTTGVFDKVAGAVKFTGTQLTSLAGNITPLVSDKLAVDAVKLTGTQLTSLAGDIPRLVSDIRAIIKSKRPTGKEAVKLAESAANTAKDLSSMTQGIIKLSSDGAKLAADTTGGIAAVLGGGINAGYTVNGGITFYKSLKRIDRAKKLGKDNKDTDGKAKDRELNEVLEGIQSRAKKKAIHSFIRAAGGTIAVTGSAVAIAATAGAAVPAIVAPLIGAAGSFIGAATTIEKSANYTKKAKEKMLGVGRKELAKKIFTTMQQLDKEGNKEWALQLARTLTNNKVKTHIIVAGCKVRSTPKEQDLARSVMEEKLKTW